MLLGGMSLMTIGLFLLLRITPEQNYVGTILPGMLLVCLGMGPSFTTMGILGAQGVRQEEQGLAAGLLSTTQKRKRCLMFSEQERAFLQAQPLARIATVATDGQPTVDVVGFEFDGARFYIGGHSVQATRKYKNVVAGNTKVSLVIDDLKSLQPWQPRGIRVHGIAEVAQRNGHLGAGSYLVITPEVSWSWGIEGSIKKRVWE